MGVYDTYGKSGVQIKDGNDGISMNDFSVGDKVPLGDGIYIGHEGTIVIKDGIFIAEGLLLADKWGAILDHGEIVKLNNPIMKAVDKMLGRKDK